MEPSTVYFVGTALVLVIILVITYWNHDDNRAIKELLEKIHDKWARGETRLLKCETAVEWFLSQKGMMLDESGSWTKPWMVTPLDGRKDTTMNDLWNEFVKNRETIAYFLYEAHLKAMRDFNEEQTKTKRNNK